MKFRIGAVQVFLAVVLAAVSIVAAILVLTNIKGGWVMALVIAVPGVAFAVAYPLVRAKDVLSVAELRADGVTATLFGRQWFNAKWSEIETARKFWVKPHLKGRRYYFPYLVLIKAGTDIDVERMIHSDTSPTNCGYGGDMLVMISPSEKVLALIREHCNLIS